MDNILSGKSFNGEMSPEEFEERKVKAEGLFKEFLETLGYDVDNDPNMKDTPRRYVKVMMKEIGRGTYLKAPKVTAFENQQNYNGIVCERNIKVRSLCSHHLAFIKGYCHVAYIPGKTVVGLSKLNRIVDWFCRRPQLQEQLTQQIHDYLCEILGENMGVAVMIEAEHTCVSMRGVEDPDSITTTCKLSGVFLNQNNKSREEFYNMIKR